MRGDISFISVASTMSLLFILKLCPQPHMHILGISSPG